MIKKTIQFFFCNASILWLLSFIFCMLSGYASAGGPGQVVKVTASIMDETVIPGDQLASEGETRNVDRFPENPESYFPMPLPDPTEYDESDAVPLEDNKAISYDVATGQETVHEIEKVLGNTPLANLTEGNLGRGESLKAYLESESPAGDQPHPMRMGSMVRVGPTASNPWRRNVRIFFRSGNSLYSCSGALISRRVVLTAGHCVYFNGVWSTNVVVVPAYRNGARPYGSASAILLRSFTGWTRNGQWNHDIGVIRLGRNIGSVVGWFRYGSKGNLTWFLGKVWHNASYPAEPPFNGQWMYYWFGPPDFLSGLQIGFLNQAYGGMSGSNLYRLINGKRIVYAVLSNGPLFPPPFWWRAPIITPQKKPWIDGARSFSAAFDLEPLAVEVDTAASTMAYLVANNSAHSWSGTVTANVYLSKNSNISTSDTLIQTHEFGADFGPNAAVEVEVPSLTIPEDTPTGQYWVGVVLDIDDGNLKNNDSDGQDARQILLIK